MAEKIDERKVQMGSTGACILALPRSWVKDVGLIKGDSVEILREGSSIIVRPKPRGGEQGNGSTR